MEFSVLIWRMFHIINLTSPETIQRTRSLCQLCFFFFWRKQSLLVFIDGIFTIWAFYFEEKYAKCSRVEITFATCKILLSTGVPNRLQQIFLSSDDTSTKRSRASGTMFHPDNGIWGRTTMCRRNNTSLRWCFLAHFQNEKKKANWSTAASKYIRLQFQPYAISAFQKRSSVWKLTRTF